MHSPCDARNIQKCLPLFPAQGIHKRWVNLKFNHQNCNNHKPAISSRHSIFHIPFTRASPTLRTPSVCTVRVMSETLTPLFDSRHTKAGGKFTPLRACQRVRPCCSNVPFPVGDVAFTFFSAKCVRSNLSPKTCNHYMLCRLCN